MGRPRLIDPSPSQDIRVCVVVPTSSGAIKSYTAQCIANMMTYYAVSSYKGGQHSVIFRTITGSMLCGNRHLSIKTAMDLKSTHVLMCDSDMAFPNNALHQLLRWGKPIVGVNYARKVYPHLPTASYFGFNELVVPAYSDNGHGEVDLAPVKEPLAKVGHLGLGLVLIEMSVFETIEEKSGLPFFKFQPKFKDDEYDGEVGEDVYFFRKARDCGFDVWCDMQLSNECKHCGEVEFGLEFSARADFMEKQRKEDEDDGAVNF